MAEMVYVIYTTGLAISIRLGRRWSTRYRHFSTKI